MGAALPHVPAAALRRALRDQPVDAHARSRVDVDRARAQWDGLVANLRGRRRRGRDDRAAGRHVPDLVFTANAGLVSGDRFVPSHFRHPERQPETPVFAAWFDGRRLRACGALPDELDHEGAGDALPFRRQRVLLSGYRSAQRRRRRHAELSRLLGVPGALGRAGRRAAVPRRPHVLPARRPPRHLRARSAGTATAARWSRRSCPSRCGSSDDEALSFCANSVVVGTQHRDAGGARRGSAASSRRGASTVVESPRRRVPEGRRRLPLPHAGPRRGA